MLKKATNKGQLCVRNKWHNQSRHAWGRQAFDFPPGALAPVEWNKVTRWNKNDVRYGKHWDKIKGGALESTSAVQNCVVMCWMQRTALLFKQQVWNRGYLLRRMDRLFTFSVPPSVMTTVQWIQPPSGDGERKAFAMLPWSGALCNSSWMMAR